MKELLDTGVREGRLLRALSVSLTNHDDGVIEMVTYSIKDVISRRTTHSRRANHRERTAVVMEKVAPSLESLTKRYVEPCLSNTCAKMLGPETRDD